MPYRKYARRRGARRGRGRKMRGRMGPGGYDYNNLARKAMSGVKFLKSLINTEKKILDTSFTNSGIASTGTVQWLSAITTGTGFNQRTGMVVKGFNISIRGMLSWNSASSTQQQIRAILFRNLKLNQGATPAASDILQNTGGAGSIYSPYNVDNIGDFQVLHDRVYMLDGVARNQQILKIFARVPYHIRWDQAGDAITDTESGHLFLLLVSDEASTTPTAEFTCRLRFIDN